MKVVVFGIAKGLNGKDFKAAKDILTACGAEFNWDTKKWVLTSDAAETKYVGASGAFGPQLSWNILSRIKCGDILVEEGADFIQTKPHDEQGQYKSLVSIAN